MATKLRIFHCSDIHGSEKSFRKFLNAAKFYDAKVLILGGDLTGKMMIPIIEERDGAFRTELMGEELILRSEEEVRNTEKMIRDMGHYPLRCTRGEYDELASNKSKADHVFNQLMVEGVRRWVSMAEERLAGEGVEVYIMPGNDDIFAIDSALEGSEVVANPEGRAVEVAGRYEMISTGYVNMTPWHAPRDIPEEKLGEIIDGLVSQVRDMSRCIFDFHAPPYDTPLDLAPKIDEDFKPITSGGEVVMVHVGSTSVRHAIEKNQPLLALHGHIHESKGVTRIGRTLCVNAGSDYASGILQGALIVLENAKVKSYQLTAG